MPQGSILGPLLFIIFINGIDEGIVSDILKFADDTKIFRKAGTVDNINKLREDLQVLCNWSDMWQMKFNIEKCKVMHIGAKNLEEEYFMEGVTHVTAGSARQTRRGHAWPACSHCIVRRSIVISSALVVLSRPCIYVCNSGTRQ